MKSFYDILQDILLKKSGILHKEEGFNKYFTIFMLCRYLSMRSDLIVYAEILNNFQGILTNEQVYKWAYNNVPKQKQGFIKYISKKKKK